MGLVEGDDEATTRAAVAAGVARWVPDESERRWIEHALLVLLGFEGSAGAAREELFSAWRTFFERIAATGPVVLLFEDLHWADAGLLDFIDHLLDWSTGVPVTIVTLARPELIERRPGWGSGQRTFVGLALEPLPDDAMGEILEALAPGLQRGWPGHDHRTRRRHPAVRGRDDPDARRGRDPRRCGRRPGRSAGRSLDLAVPATLQALIAARLDALEPADRSLICDAAVLGQSFTPAGLGAVSGLDPDRLDASLRALVRRELLVHDVDPRSPERGQFAFVQSLVREVAYGTLSKRGPAQPPSRRSAFLRGSRRGRTGWRPRRALPGGVSRFERTIPRVRRSRPRHGSRCGGGRTCRRRSAVTTRRVSSSSRRSRCRPTRPIGRTCSSVLVWRRCRWPLGDRPRRGSRRRRRSGTPSASVEREARAVGLRGRAVVNGWRAPDAIAFLEPALAAFEDLGDDPALVLRSSTNWRVPTGSTKTAPGQCRLRIVRLDARSDSTTSPTWRTSWSRRARSSPSTGGRTRASGRWRPGARWPRSVGSTRSSRRALLNMAGSPLEPTTRVCAFELGLEGITLARRIGFRSFLATAAGNSLEVALGDRRARLGDGHRRRTAGARIRAQ